MLSVDGVDLAFESLFEMVERADSPEPEKLGRLTRDEGQYDFFGTHTWEEARTLALSGYDDVRPMVDEMVPSVMEDLETVEQTQMLPLWDVAGGAVDIGRFLSGEPECMVDFSMQDVPADRLVKLVVSGNAPWFIDKGDMMKRGAVIVALVEALSLAKYSVELWVEVAVSPQSRARKPLVVLCRIKGAEDPLDINAFMFSVAHASFLRRVTFGVWETMDTATRKRFGALPGGGYGTHDIRTVVSAEALDAHVSIPMIQRGDQIVNKPVEWLRSTVRRIQEQGVSVQAA